MRVLHLVAGAKWTGPAAVAIDQVRALRAAGIEAEIGFTAASPLAQRFVSEGWARPMFSGGAAPAAFFRDVGRVSEKLEREGFDLLHAHASHDHLVALAAAPRRGFPTVRSFHHARTLRAWVGMPWTARGSAGHVFSNGAIAEAFRSRFGARGPSRVFSPVVDRDRFRPGSRDARLLESLGVPKDSFLVGTIGKIARGRGHDAAVRILSGTEDPSITILQVGKGNQEKDIRRLAESLGVGARHFGAGYQEERLPDLYRSMDAFLFTASGADQGHRAVREAMASGLPVVSLAIPGIEDARLPKGSGLVCPSEEEAAAALTFLRTHPEQRAAMGARARKESERFSAEAFAADAGAFYAEALEFWNNRKRKRVTMPLRETP
ncbi:MAG: glycosyltransferase family 4 protein [Thermoanaerobaculia bacterium]